MSGDVGFIDPEKVKRFYFKLEKICENRKTYFLWLSEKLCCLWLCCQVIINSFYLSFEFLLIHQNKPGVGECPVEDGLEFIIWEWFKLLPNDAADEWLFKPIIDDPSEVTIDCCWCWLSSWSRGGDIGSAFIFTGAGEEEEGGGGVLLLTAKCGIPLERRTQQSLATILNWMNALPGVLQSTQVLMRRIPWRYHVQIRSWHWKILRTKRTRVITEPRYWSL